MKPWLSGLCKALFNYSFKRNKFKKRKSRRKPWVGSQKPCILIRTLSKRWTRLPKVPQPKKRSLSEPFFVGWEIRSAKKTNKRDKQNKQWSQCQGNRTSPPQSTKWRLDRVTAKLRLPLIWKLSKWCTCRCKNRGSGSFWSRRWKRSLCRKQASRLLLIWLSRL